MKLKQIILLFSGCFVGFLNLLLFKQPIFAQVVFTDDFSDGYTKWQDVRNTFDMWSIVQQQADVFINQSSTLAEIIPKNEYWNDAWKNYIYKLDFTYLDGADKALSFWFQDTFNWYQFHFIGNNYLLSHIENGQEIWRQIGSLVLDAGRTYNMEVHLKDGNIKFFLDNLQQFDYFDPTFNNDYGRIGLKAGSGVIFPTHVQFDNIVVSLFPEISDFVLPITPLKQIDPLWKDKEYDTATKWSTKGFTIGDWGCLVTSINMILKYHNITTFPDQTEITPESLNNWLQNQEDGFVESGLVNWSAISRLVKQIHDKYGTVNLEYSRINGEQLETATEEIQKNNPVILEIPGHFLVGHGFNQAQNDLIITDPVYPHQLLSQHQVPLRSTRLLTPSYTDLSYIHLGHNNKIQVSLTNPDTSIPNSYQSYSQFLYNQAKTEQSPELILHEFAKPESENYIIKIVSTTQNPEPFKLTIFTYDIDANLTNLTYSGIAGTLENSTTLTINFNKNAPSTIISNVSFEQLVVDIKNLKDKNEITKSYVANELLDLTYAAINSGQENKSRYIPALTTTINWFSEYISESAKNILIERVTEIQKNI